MDAAKVVDNARIYHSAGGIPVTFRLDRQAFPCAPGRATREQLRLHLTLAHLQLLRGFDQLLCLDGLCGVEHLPHQIETVRKVLRRFRGRVLLADEVGLGKTIEACLLLREYLLRGLARRVLILVPNPLVSQWQDELAGKFHLDFTVPPRTSTSSRPEFWQQTDRVLVATSFARSGNRPAAIAAATWDVVIVDEAHHCKNRKTKLWQLVNSLKRRHMFLLTATPVQNNLVELYSLLTLLEPGHLKTEAEFKRQFVTRGNPRDPRNRQRLRELLGEVMIRNTRSLVQIDLPPRYAQTIIAIPGESERQLQAELTRYLRERSGAAVAQECLEGGVSDDESDASSALPRMRLQSLLNALGSHPTTAAAALDKLAAVDPAAASLQRLALSVSRSAKDDRLLDLLRDSHGHKVLVFVNAIRTLHRLQELLTSEGIAFSTFSGEQSAAEKDDAVESLRNRVPVMLCTDSGGEGRNLQFADTLVNYDLPWNPMRIEQRIGRVHRFGQTQDVFVFNLCTEGSIESRILGLLNDKIRMFELVVGEVGSILGNLEEGDEFESLVLKLWMKADDEQQLEQSFAELGDALLDAQEEYLNAKNLDEALFGEDFE
ncbi:MAG: DEAD/DEAH box helicase [Pirellulaceae bacterium]